MTYQLQIYEQIIPFELLVLQQSSYVKCLFMISTSVTASELNYFELFFNIESPMRKAYDLKKSIRPKSKSNA